MAKEFRCDEHLADRSRLMQPLIRVKKLNLYLEASSDHELAILGQIKCQLVQHSRRQLLGPLLVQMTAVSRSQMSKLI